MFDPEVVIIVTVIGVICALSREIRAWYVTIKNRRPPSE